MAREYHGGCQCGRVRYSLAAAPRSACICHCRSCQRAAGAPMVPWGSFDRAALRWREARPEIFQSSPGVRRGFCGRCGTTLTYAEDGDPKRIDVALATLDRPGAIRPDAHIWTAHRQSWIKLDDGLPQYRGWRRGG